MRSEQVTRRRRPFPAVAGAAAALALCSLATGAGAQTTGGEQPPATGAPSGEDQSQHQGGDKEAAKEAVTSIPQVPGIRDGTLGLPSVGTAKGLKAALDTKVFQAEGATDISAFAGLGGLHLTSSLTAEITGETFQSTLPRVLLDGTPALPSMETINMASLGFRLRKHFPHTPIRVTYLGTHSCIPLPEEDAKIIRDAQDKAAAADAKEDDAAKARADADVADAAEAKARAEDDAAHRARLIVDAAKLIADAAQAAADAEVEKATATVAGARSKAAKAAAGASVARAEQAAQAARATAVEARDAADKARDAADAAKQRANEAQEAAKKARAQATQAAEDAETAQAEAEQAKKAADKVAKSLPDHETKSSITCEGQHAAVAFANKSAGWTGSIGARFISRSVVENTDSNARGIG